MKYQVRVYTFSYSKSGLKEPLMNHHSADVIAGEYYIAEEYLREQEGNITITDVRSRRVKAHIFNKRAY